MGFIASLVVVFLVVVIVAIMNYRGVLTRKKLYAEMEENKRKLFWSRLK